MIKYGGTYKEVSSNGGSLHEPPLGDDQFYSRRTLRQAPTTITVGTAIRAARHALYRRSKQSHPARWFGNTRDWSHIGAVTFNPEREAIVNMATNAPHTQQQAT